MIIKPYGYQDHMQNQYLPCRWSMNGYNNFSATYSEEKYQPLWSKILESSFLFMNMYRPLLSTNLQFPLFI